MSKYSITPTPRDRIIEPGQPLSLAGDRTRRKAAAEARRAERAAMANDPDRQERRAQEATRYARERMASTLADAMGRRDRIVTEQARLLRLRDQLDTAALRTGILDDSASAIDAKLAQVPRLLAKAEAEIIAAQTTLDAHDAAVAAQVAQRQAELRAAQAEPVPVTPAKKGKAK